MFATTMTLALALTSTPFQGDFPEAQSYYDPQLQAIVMTEIDEDPRPVLFNGVVVGKDLTGWAIPQARYSAGNWKAGNKATVSARDSLGLNDLKTTFHNDYCTVGRNYTP